MVNAWARFGIYAVGGVCAAILVLTSRFSVAAQKAPVLPPGNGRELVMSTCSQCHDLNRVVRAGYTREGWVNTVSMMVNMGAHLTPEQVQTVSKYLAANFPEKPAPAAVIISGNTSVTIKEWRVPTQGSRPHDPLATSDGNIWYTGQMANVLGRLDPRTGKFREFRLPIPDSGPHGLVADTDGNIWFTANFKGYIGKLNPNTGKVDAFQLDAAARDPHTPLFDRRGILWFTVQGANMVGRLDPKTGVSRIVNVPTAHANPYGMVINSKDIPFFAEFGTNKLASIDPQTMTITEYRLANPDARPRRIAITSDDVLWYSDYARGYLGRYDPKTHQQQEWPSPGGPKSQPYGITALKGAIWYSESGVAPNTLVRFDIATHKFQTWAIPSGGYVIRNMMPTSDGNIVMACSGANRIALAYIR